VKEKINLKREKKSRKKKEETRREREEGKIIHKESTERKEEKRKWEKKRTGINQIAQTKKREWEAPVPGLGNKELRWEYRDKNLIFWKWGGET
jgi:hypothetical protein